MTQEIKIEVDDHNFTTLELESIVRFARKYPEQNIRVNDDPTNLKIYIGPYYKEQYRFWVLPNGVSDLVEHDFSDPKDEDAIWDSVALYFAHSNLVIAHLL